MVRIGRRSNAGGIIERTLDVLLAVEGGRLTRDRLYGDLAPWELDARSVSLEVTMLAVLGLIQLDPLNRNAPCLTTRGRKVLSRARDHAVTDLTPR